MVSCGFALNRSPCGSCWLPTWLMSGVTFGYLQSLLPSSWFLLSLSALVAQAGCFLRKGVEACVSEELGAG